MSEDPQQTLDAIQSFIIACQESKRTILCEPHREHQVRAAIDQAGAVDIFTVRPSLLCPEGKLLVIDENAIAAQAREWQQGLRLWGGGLSDRA